MTRTRGSELWDRLNEHTEIEVTPAEYKMLQPHIMEWLAPGDGFKVERTLTGFIVTLIT